MMTREHILAGFALLEGAGIRKPDAMVARSDKPADIETARNAVLTSADVWAAVLADVTPDDFRAAILARVRGGGAFWPTVGEILALVPARQAAAVDDAEEAWAKVLRIAREKGRAAGTENNRWRFDPDAGRLRAMWAGIDAAGGWNAICDTTEHGYMRPAFLGAYRSARAKRALRIESDAVTQIAEASPVKRLEERRGGGFRSAFAPPARGGA